MSAHSKIGASSCERWWNCPGSVRLVAQCPPQKPSLYAAEGTAAHTVGEKCLKNGTDASAYVGRVIKVEGYDITVTDEMADAVQMYLDTIRFDMETYDLKKEDIKIEHRFHLTHIDEDAFGTNDCNLPVFLDKVIVYDYKHGQGVAVDAEENKQLMYYALGAAELGDYDTIEVVIVQPRAIHRDGPIRRWTLTVDDLKAFAEECKLRIAATRLPDADLNCGPWCKKTFCPAMATCPAIRGTVETEAMVVFEKPVAALPRPESLSPETLKRILDAMPLMDEWLKAVWAYAEQKANNGEQLLGYKLVQGQKGHRKWADEQKVKETFENFIHLDIFEPPALVSPAKLEKQIMKDKILQEKINGLTTRSDGKIILVPESDPREAVQPSATQVFIETEVDIFS